MKRFCIDVHHKGYVPGDQYGDYASWYYQCGSSNFKGDGYGNGHDYGYGGYSNGFGSGNVVPEDTLTLLELLAYAD